MAERGQICGQYAGGWDAVLKLQKPQQPRGAHIASGQQKLALPKDSVFSAGSSSQVGSHLESVLCSYGAICEYNMRVEQQAHRLPALPEQKFRAVQSKTEVSQSGAAHNEE